MQQALQLSARFLDRRLGAKAVLLDRHVGELRQEQAKGEREAEVAT